VYADLGAARLAARARHPAACAFRARRRRRRQRGALAGPRARGLRSHRADNVSLAGSAFTHSSLEGAQFIDVALTGARFSNPCLGDVTIEDANYAGMRIEGILVTELLRVYRQQSAAPDAVPPGTG
jgi:uncharacterized protein YjbI with pentapeptide repeats